MTSPSPSHNSSSSNSHSTPNDWKLRKPVPRSSSATPENPLRRHTATSVTSLPQSRNKSIHQSNGSLHSDSPSSSSVSPAPSPSPRPSSLHAGLAKRWSSTGDFGGVPSPLSGNR